MFFHSTNQHILSFEEMFDKILQFIEEDPSASYRIAIGSDSQVKHKTYFVTAILVHRVGKGAIGFLREIVIPRPITSLREKISLEITFTQEVAFMFTPEHLDKFHDLIRKSNNKFSHKHLDLEIHLDIGTKGPTKNLIKEMVNRVSGLGFQVKIKPFATAASSLANRYTK